MLDDGNTISMRIAIFCLIALLATPAASTAEHKHGTDPVCCRFKASRRPSWSTTLRMPVPDLYDNCDWFPDHARIIFPAPTVVIAALHQDCFLKNGAVPPVPVHTLDTLVALNAQTANVTKQLTWKDVALEARGGGSINLLNVKDGNFLFHAGLTLRLCDSNLNELRSRTLQSINWRNEQWLPLVSADGKSILLKHWNTDKDSERWSEEHWISPETLQDIRSFRTALYSWDSLISGNQVFYNLARRGSVSPSEDLVYVRQIGDREGHPFCSACTGVALAATSTGTVIVAATTAELWLVDPSGNVILRKKLGGLGDNIEHVEATQKGSLFAFSFGHSRDFIVTRGFDTFVLFDSDAKQQRFRFKTTTYPYDEGEGWQRLDTPSFALSPAANQIVLLDGYVLKSFLLSP